jgi:hypothetical protein
VLLYKTTDKAHNNLKNPINPVNPVYKKISLHFEKPEIGLS